MNDEKYFEERQIASFLGIRWGVGERMVESVKGLICSRMFKERVGITGPWLLVFLKLRF